MSHTRPVTQFPENLQLKAFLADAPLRISDVTHDWWHVDLERLLPAVDCLLLAFDPHGCRLLLPGTRHRPCRYPAGCK